MSAKYGYGGRVGWIDDALAYADTWTDRTLEAVMARFPYPDQKRVRPSDWVALVAHVSRHVRHWLFLHGIDANKARP